MKTDGLIKSIDALLSLDARGALVPHGIGDLARELLEKCAEALTQPAEQKQGELERLREHVGAYEASRARLHEWLRKEQLKNIALRSQLAEQVSLLRDMHDSPYHYIRDFKPRIDAALSASAEPVTPQSEPEKPSRCTSCDNCQGFNTGHDSSQQLPYSIRCDNCHKEARAVDHSGLTRAWNALNQSE
ncbi:hypothetical protein [Pseudomonas urethralis]|uniref:hypothetical protein n=1 Tax=Pseudomonas urethralis TaxID=2740517 RepID=UPI000C1746E8|nr:hypothetical protein [Pseudomonas urethralis]PIK76350.1 hypothetical protein CQW31_22425 [Pseudomonas sp. 382]